MSRLASLSTPSRTRSSPSPSPSPSPAPSTRGETTHHRMLKLVLAEIKSVHRTWDELVGVDGLKAGKGVVDESTTMDAPGERPSIASHLDALYAQRSAMQAVIAKLYKALARLSLLVDQAEKLYFEAHRLQGAEWADEEPLWLSWSMLRFVNSLPPLLSLHSHHLHLLLSLQTTLLSPSTPFDAARLALERWRDVAHGGERWDGVREWEELVELEMTWGEVDEEDDADEVGAGRRGAREGTPGSARGGVGGKGRRKKT